jgi:hypothetical protein
MLIAIPTKNRTAVFGRCLESLRDNADKFGREIKFLVVDDSDDGSNQGNQRVLETVGAPYCYYDRKAVADYASYLSRQAGCSPSLTEFAFRKTPNAHGAVRNFLLLRSVHEPFIMIDDDMVCKFADVPNRNDEIEYDLSPTVVYLKPTIIPPVEEAQLVDDDFIGKYEALLKKVPLVMGGSIGDSGVTHSYEYLKSSRLLEQIAVAPEAMLQRLHTRQLLRATLQPKIVNWCSCVGMNFAFDPSHSFPPFFPVGRGEDVLFGGMLRNCFNELSGYCNFSMWHSPLRPDTEDIAILGQPTAPEFMYKLLIEVNPDSLEMFSQTLDFICKQDLTWVEEKHRTRIIKVLDKACEGQNFPELLVQEIDRVKGVLRDAPPYNIPYDLIKEYGDLMAAWPRIVEAARQYGR